MIVDKLKEIMQLQNNIKLDDLEYPTKRGKRYNFRRYSLHVVPLRDIHKGNLSLEDADKEQIQLANELNDMSKGKIPIEKGLFLKNAKLVISERENILNNFKDKIFLKKNPEPEPEQTVLATP